MSNDDKKFLRNFCIDIVEKKRRVKICKLKMKNIFFKMIFSEIRVEFRGNIIILKIF